jgi:hypothetical protein
LAAADGAGPSPASSVHTLGDVRLTLEGLPVRTDGIFAIDMTHTNQKLMMKGVDPIRAVMGQDMNTLSDAKVANIAGGFWAALFLLDCDGKPILGAPARRRDCDDVFPISG